MPEICSRCGELIAQDDFLGRADFLDLPALAKGDTNAPLPLKQKFGGEGFRHDF